MEKFSDTLKNAVNTNDISIFGETHTEKIVNSYFYEHTPNYSKPTKIDLNSRFTDLYKDLYKVRNARPALSKFGILLGSIYAGIEMWLHSLKLGFFLPWTFDHKDDHLQLKPAKKCLKFCILNQMVKLPSIA